MERRQKFPAHCYLKTKDWTSSLKPFLKIFLKTKNDWTHEIL